MGNQILFLLLIVLFFYSALVSRKRLQYAQAMYLGHPPSRWEVLFNTTMMVSVACMLLLVWLFVQQMGQKGTLSWWFFIYLFWSLTFGYSAYTCGKLLWQRLWERKGTSGDIDSFTENAFFMGLIFLLLAGMFTTSAWLEFQAALR